MGSPTAWLRIFSDKLRLSKIVVCSRYLLVKRFIPSFRSTVKDLLSRRAGYPKVLSLGNSELIFLNRKEGCQGGIKLHGLKVFFPDKPPVYRAKECSLRKIEFSIPEIWGRGRSPQGCGLPLRKFLTTTTIFRKNNSESASGENGLTNLFDFKAENFEIDNPDVKKEKYFEYQRNLSEEALSPKSLIKKHLSGKKVSGEQLQSGRELNIRSNPPKSSKNFITELRNSQKCIGESSQRELVPESQDAQGFVSSLQELCPKGRIVSFQVSFNVKSRRRVKSFRWSGFFFPFKKKKIPKILKSGNIFLNPRRKVFPIKGSIANMKDLLGVKKKTPKK
jgi:hypothetical protein